MLKTPVSLWDTLMAPHSTIVEHLEQEARNQCETSALEARGLADDLAHLVRTHGRPQHVTVKTRIDGSKEVFATVRVDHEFLTLPVFRSRQSLPAQVTMLTQHILLNEYHIQFDDPYITQLPFVRGPLKATLFREYARNQLTLSVVHTAVPQ
jgi:hypothetical protein